MFLSLLNSLQRAIINICISIFQCVCWIKSEFRLYIFEVFLCRDNIRQLVCMWGFSMEAIISSREPMISSRPGIGMEMFCCSHVCAPVHKRAKVGNQARNSHGLSFIYLPKDHHAMRGSLWMPKSSPSLKCLGRVWGFTWFTFPEAEQKSAGRTKEQVVGLDLQKRLFLLFSVLSIPSRAGGHCSRLTCRTAGS